jgi:hypothetical protein
MARHTPTERAKKTHLAREESLLPRLTAALSEAELRRVLVCSLLVMDDAARGRLVERLDSETGATLQALLQPARGGTRGAKPSGPVTSRGKLQQEWERLWSEWAAVVDETGRVEGKYIQQEERWDPPYLDTTAISEDLDSIAARMRPMIVPIIQQEIDPDFSFSEAIEELDRDLGKGLHEWLEPPDDSCLGREVTLCLLEWEWTVAQRNSLGTPAFVDSIRDLERRLEQSMLDEEALEEFILGLSDEHLRAILESLIRQRASKRWADAFSEARGAWPELLRELSYRWQPALHEELCRANISQDWTLALPLIEGALKRKAVAEALSLIDEALRSMLSPRGEEDRWDPRGQLLVHKSYYNVDPLNESIASLFRLWQGAARAEGQADLDAALALQLKALHEAEKGDAMLEAFRAIPPRFQQVRDALFADWRAFLTQRTFKEWGVSTQPPGSGWVPALVNAAMAGPQHASEFHAAVRAVLQEASTALKDRRVAARQPGWTRTVEESPFLRPLAILTLDLDATAPTLKKTAPRLFKLLASEAREERGGVNSTRRKWCARLGGASLLPEVLAFWRDHGVKFVPDPGSTTGNYAESADWLAAIHELNPEVAEELLAQWEKVHSLKRNLWRDLAQRGISVAP